MDHPIVDEIREVIETKGDKSETRITDLHVWRVGKQVYSCALSVVTRDPALSPSDIRQRLAVHKEIVHATIEIHRYPEAGSNRNQLDGLMENNSGTASYLIFLKALLLLCVKTDGWIKKLMARLMQATTAEFLKQSVSACLFQRVCKLYSCESNDNETTPT